MSKLTLAYALLALEAAGYEQGSHKPYSFAKVTGPVTIVCRVNTTDGIIKGDYVASVRYVGLTYQCKLSVPLMIESDILRAEGLIFDNLKAKVLYSRDQAKDTWESLDKTYLNLQTLLKLSEPKK